MEMPTYDTDGLTVGKIERWGSMLGGGALVVYGLSRKSLGGLALAVLGGDLVYHGLVRDDGHLREALGLENPEDKPGMSIPHGHGFKIERSITVDRPAEELYRFWRNFENLPQFMDHLESVQVIDDLHSHWVAKAPVALKAEWDAEIINDIPNELIGWRSLEGSDVPNAGSVHFEPAARGRTKLTVVMKYDPPAGPVGEAVAKLFGESPSQTVRAELLRFKELMQFQQASMQSDSQFMGLGE